MNEDALREELDRQATSMMERQEGEATALHKLGSHQTPVAPEPASIRETGLPATRASLNTVSERKAPALQRRIMDSASESSTRRNRLFWVVAAGLASAVYGRPFLDCFRTDESPRPRAGMGVGAAIIAREAGLRAAGDQPGAPHGLPETAQPWIFLDRQRPSSDLHPAGDPAVSPELSGCVSHLEPAVPVAAGA